MSLLDNADQVIADLERQRAELRSQLSAECFRTQSLEGLKRRAEDVVVSLTQERDALVQELSALRTRVDDSNVLRLERDALLQELGALRAKEPPLLQCVDCRNTESCAGAMARVFNRGRCLHCVGFFKVMRA